MFMALPNSGENVTRMPTTYQIGIPISTTRRYFARVFADVNSDRKLPALDVAGAAKSLEHAGLGDADAQNEQRDAHAAADEVRDAPVEVVADQRRGDGAENADASPRPWFRSRGCGPA